jgi:hypothetical protein
VEFEVKGPRKPLRHTLVPERGEGRRLFTPAVVAAGVSTAIVTAAFVWFVARAIGSRSGFGTLLVWLLNTLAVVLVAGAIAGVVIAVYAAAQRSRRVTPRPDGRFPMRLTYLDSAQASAMVVDRLTRSRYAEATRQLPDGVQTVSTTHNAWPLELEEEAAPIEVDARALTTWAELTMAGEIRPGPPVLGWDVIDRQIVRLRWKEDLGSVGVFGMSGSGKTTAGVVLAAQVAKAGGRLFLCDPHAGDDESLATRLEGLKPAFAGEVAQSEQEVVRALGQAVEMLEARKAGDEDRSPILVVADELTSLMLRARADVEPPLSLIGVEGRKYGVHACVFGQVGTAKDAGLVRSVVQSTLVFRMRPDQARYAVGYPLGTDIREYGDGQCYIAAKRDRYERVQVPWITPAEVAEIGRELAGGAELPALTTPPLHLVASTGEDGRRWGMEPGDRDQFSVEDEHRIVALYLAGRKVPEIVWDLRKVRAGGNARYRKLAEAVDAVIRAQLQAVRGGESE